MAPDTWYMPTNRLFYGDNLPVLREHIASESVDLVYLDPPFNSNRSYSVIFGEHVKRDADANAQIQAFDDTWHWTSETERLFRDILINSPAAVADAMQAFRNLLGENDAMAYLVMMAPRLVELHRALKPTGSLYLHCDSTMSHYLKVLLDQIFGAEHYRNEIIWKRTTGVKGNAGQGARHYGRSTDTIFYYVKSKIAPYYQQFGEYTQEAIAKQFKHVEEGTGRRYSLDPIDGPGGAAKGNAFYELMGVAGYWRYSREVMNKLVAEGRIVQTKPGNKPRRKKYLDEGKGVAVSNLWTDLPNLQASSAEALGYPTQKPLSLLERIIQTSTQPGDVVLDPFCGCGTTVDAAQKIGRSWVGIDITYISIDLIIKRLQATFGQSVMENVEVDGIPYDMQSAQRLFEKSPFDFERWAVSMLHAQPNEKQVGDKGIDGVRRFIIDNKTTGKVLVSVKGGKTVPPTHVRDLAGTVHNARDAQLGVLITLNDSLTRGAQEVIDTSGFWTHPANGQDFPTLQHISVRELMSGNRPNLPTALAPYISARRGIELVDQGTLFG